jgi:hypothetical protein
LCIHSAPVPDHLPIVALVVGYAAGVAIGISLRPWIAIPSVLLAVIPVISASLAVEGAAHPLLAVVLAALLAGGTNSMIARYRDAVEAIELRHRWRRSPEPTR